ncbi:MAG: hypothetical protein RSA97_08510, partial [Oscillospiraceae bacterium]
SDVSVSSTTSCSSAAHSEAATAAVLFFISLSLARKRLFYMGYVMRFSKLDALEFKQREILFADTALSGRNKFPVSVISRKSGSTPDFRDSSISAHP